MVCDWFVWVFTWGGLKMAISTVSVPHIPPHIPRTALVFLGFRNPAILLAYFPRGSGIFCSEIVRAARSTAFSTPGPRDSIAALPLGSFPRPVLYTERGKKLQPQHKKKKISSWNEPTDRDRERERERAHDVDDDDE